MRLTKTMAQTCMLAVTLMLLAVACEEAQGTGAITGRMTIPPCEQDNAEVNIEPRFFAATPLADRHLEIRMQGWSDFEEFSDGISFFIEDAAELAETMRGVPIQLGTRRPKEYRANMYFNRTCRPRPFLIGENFRAVSGTLTLNAFGPVADDDAVSGRFDDVHFVDTDTPDEEFATVSGSFDFLFVRGRPGQRFP